MLFLQAVYAPLYFYSVLFPPCAILTIYYLHTLSALFTDADLFLITQFFCSCPQFFVFGHARLGTWPIQDVENSLSLFTTQCRTTTVATKNEINENPLRYSFLSTCIHAYPYCTACLTPKSCCYSTINLFLCFHVRNDYGPGYPNQIHKKREGGEKYRREKIIFRSTNMRIRC